jgi:hypothetical protein
LHVFIQATGNLKLGLRLDITETVASPTASPVKEPAKVMSPRYASCFSVTNRTAYIMKLPMPMTKLLPATVRRSRQRKSKRRLRHKQKERDRRKRRSRRGNAWRCLKLKRQQQLSAQQLSAQQLSKHVWRRKKERPRSRGDSQSSRPVQK